MWQGYGNVSVFEENGYNKYKYEAPLEYFDNMIQITTCLTEL